MEHSNIIELNGKRYDAVTGKYLGKSHATPVPARHSPAQGRVVNDIVRPAIKAAPAGEHHKAHAAPAKKPGRHHKSAQTHPHRPEHSKTLMRHAVKKPVATLKPKIKPQGAAEIAAAPASKLARKRSVAQVDPMRLHRALEHTKHGQVERFGRSAAAMPARHTGQAEAAHHTAHVAPKKPHDIFEAAIARANSHKQPTPRIARRAHRRKRATRIMAGVAVLLVAGLLLAWLQKPQLELRLASFQAGFQASMPSHNLTDYARGAIRQEHGQVVMDYYSGDRYYRITQQASDWNSQTLLDSAVAGASTEESQVIESKGRIIYLIEGNSASWVDGGVRYDITGNAPLTREDIIAIVESM